MFKKDTRMAKTKDDLGLRNHIAQGTKINGDVITEGDIRIDGSLEGTIRSNGKVVVGDTGSVEGEIKCQNANISGRASGKMTVTELVSFQETGVFSGDLAYGKMTVEPGARLEGTFVIAGKLKEMNNPNEKQQKGQSKKTG